MRSKVLVDGDERTIALVGGVALEDGRPKIHAHAVLGRRDGSTCGGHLGLALIDIGK